jgi:hypothetical protein
MAMGNNSTDRDDLWAAVTGYAFLWSAPLAAFLTVVLFLRG